MLTAVIAYLLGAFTVLAVVLVRRIGASAPRLRQNPMAELDRNITEFGEDLVRLSFDPVAPDTTQAAVAAYRLALDSYEKAREALLGKRTDLDLTRRVLKAGRAALAELGTLVQETVELRNDIREFGEDLVSLSFDPATPDTPEESLRDHRRVLDSYEKAREALLGEHTDLALARQSLVVGRNALIRLDARMHHRPVPVDISLAARRSGTQAPPEPRQNKRFTYSGRNDQDYVFPIDWPEPGLPAIVELTRSGEGDSYVEICTLTDTSTYRNGSDERRIEGTETIRFYLDRDVRNRGPATHLKVSPSVQKYAEGTWSLRLLRLDEAPELHREYQGAGDDVLVLRSGERARLGAQVIDTPHNWKVEYTCWKKHQRGETCSSWQGNWQWLNQANEEQRTIPVCGYGVVTVRAPEAVRWSLTVIPEVRRPR